MFSNINFLEHPRIQHALKRMRQERSVLQYAEPSPVEVITYTLTSNVGSTLDLTCVTKGIALTMNGVRRIKGPGHDKKPFSRALVGDCTFKLFNNCATAIVPCSSGKEINTKIFKNGKLQMTGCQTIHSAEEVVEKVCWAIRKGCPDAATNPDKIQPQPLDICMINSRFCINCTIDRERLNQIFQTMYPRNVHSCSFDSTKYQGINLKFHTDDNCKATVLMFQNGKVLVTGVKSIDTLNQAYAFVNHVVKTHFEEVARVPSGNKKRVTQKKPRRKRRKKK